MEAMSHYKSKKLEKKRFEHLLTNLETTPYIELKVFSTRNHIHFSSLPFTNASILFICPSFLSYLLLDRLYDVY